MAERAQHPAPRRPVMWTVAFGRHCPHGIGLTASPEKPAVAGTIHLREYDEQGARRSAAFILDPHCWILSAEPTTAAPQSIQPSGSVPTIPGTPFGGGFYAGRIAVDGNTYALIVAPKAEGEHAGAVWKTNWRRTTPGAQSLNDGLANTEAMLKAGGHPVADWARGLRIAGFDDWYLPARDELEVLYRNLKPTGLENWVYASRCARWSVEPGRYTGVDGNGNGHNASSEPPGAAYTEDSPDQTAAEAFRQDGAEAFDHRWYWSSTEFDSAYAWFQTFVDGSQIGGGKNLDLGARAARKVLI